MVCSMCYSPVKASWTCTVCSLVNTSEANHCEACRSQNSAWAPKEGETVRFPGPRKIDPVDIENFRNTVEKFCGCCGFFQGPNFAIFFSFLFYVLPRLR